MPPVLSLYEADLLVDFAQSFIRGVLGALGSGAVDSLEISLVLDETLGLLAHGAQELNDGVAHSCLEVAVAAAGELALDRSAGSA